MADGGKVYEHQPEQIATFEVVVTASYQVVSVYVATVEAIRFPMPLTADHNEVAMRLTTVINQTGLVENSVVVTWDP